MDLGRRDRLLPNGTFGSRSADVLRMMVLTGEIAPGSRLNEVELAESLGISRGPLREAVRQLIGEKLLVSVNHRGAYVKQFEADELRDVHVVRVALETLAVRLLPIDVDLSPLQESVEESHRLIAKGASDYLVAIGFHTALIELTGNQALVSATRDVQHQMLLGGSMYRYSHPRATHGVEGHRRIVDLLAAGDREGAIEVLEAHLQTALEQAVTALSQVARPSPTPESSATTTGGPK